MIPRTTMIDTDFPLAYRTPDHWAPSALQDPLALLNDHAYLERKAASNALDLLNRWPEPGPPETWVSALATIARDETQHLSDVSRLLAKRGGQLDRKHKSRYASDLRALVRQGKTPDETVDRLLVSALIEARSCERFEILGRMCPDAELASMYGGLAVAERGHYAVFLRLAELAVGTEARDRRWRDLVAAEAEIIKRQPAGAHLHSGLPDGERA
jgi:tRNA-(ms[2]io[6]A)-hydroxylase